MPQTKRMAVETPVTFLSEEQQIVGILHHGNSDKLVILCHGFTGNKCEAKRLFVEAARAFVAEGLDTLRFDFYGSGDSAGEFADSMVSHNMVNLRDAMNYGHEHGYSKIAVLGLSMGAATAILTLAEKPADALITWSAVPDMNQLFLSYVQNIQELATKVDEYIHEGWVIKKTFWQDAVQYNVPAALATIAAPKFILQGSADSPVFVNGFHAFRDIAQPPADFMEIPGAGHTFSMPAHRRQAIRQTLVWLKRHF